MGRQASPWPAILTGPEQILGARWPSLFRAAPRPVQQALLAVGRHAPGRSGSLPAERFDCVILTQVLQFLAPEQALRSRLWASIAPGGILLITVQALGRLDAALWGLSAQDLSSEELDVNGPCSPLVAGAHADKPA
jgi:hypothetical protein